MWEQLMALLKPLSTIDYCDGPMSFGGALNLAPMISRDASFCWPLLGKFSIQNRRVSNVSKKGTAFFVPCCTRGFKGPLFDPLMPLGKLHA